MITKAMKCAHKGCKNKHKNTSGYCVDHAQDIDKPQPMEVKEGRKVYQPKLAEEFNYD